MYLAYLPLYPLTNQEQHARWLLLPLMPTLSCPSLHFQESSYERATSYLGCNARSDDCDG